MPFTLSQARQKLFRYVSPVLDTGIVTDRINSALERIYNSGKWKGMLTQANFFNSLGGNWFPDKAVQYITLPRQYQAILGIQFGAEGSPAIPRLVYPTWQEFIAGGGGPITPGTSMQMAIDAGDGYPVVTDPTLPFYVQFESTDSGDSEVVIEIDGFDASGSAIFDSTGNTALSTPVNTLLDSVMFGKITAVRKPVTQGTINLYAVNPYDNSQKSLISQYEATETVPSYKRYRLSASEYAARVNCLCKRRFVELVDGPDDGTVIIPSNEGALKLTLMALQFEDKNDMERAEEYFNKAIQLLNAELKEDMGTPVITLQMNPIGAAMRIPARY